MKVENVALRDNLLAALRTQELPISTINLAALMPWRVDVTDCQQYMHYNLLAEYQRIVVCDGTTHIREIARSGYDIYRHLRALEQKGLVERVKLDGHYAVYWRGLDTEQRTAEIAELEAMWSA